jgi:creatinine amidohydrolase
LALRSQHVQMAQARDFKSSSKDRAGKYPILGNGSSAKLAWQMQDYNAQGAAGNAAAATAHKGHAILEAAGRQLASMLQELSALPLSMLVEGPASS